MAMAKVRRGWLALACLALAACGGGGGGGNDGGGGPGPVAPDANPWLPTGSDVQLFYNDSSVATRFEQTAQRNSVFVAPLRYPTGGKEYYVSTPTSVGFLGFYSPQVFVGDAGQFTVDAVLDSPVTFLRTDEPAPRTSSVNGSGKVTITPTYGTQNLTYSGSVSYGGTETVSTALGAFEARRVAVNLLFSTTVQGQTITLPFDVTFWFVEDVGIVQRLEAGQMLRLTNATGQDADGDGVVNGLDAFPNDPNESVDTDSDGQGNNSDTDDDNDGTADSADRFPLDASETMDFDNDGIGDNADTDDDNDGVPDILDPFPFDVHNTDTDSDGVADFYDEDDDNDGVADDADRFPLDASETTDFDNDGIGDNGDVDDDNDSRPDTEDAYPRDASRWQLLTTDRDSLGMSAVYGSSVMPSAVVGVRGFDAPWQLSSSASWLAVSSSSGVGPADITVSADTAQLAVGSHAATLVFADPEVEREVTVTVEIDIALPAITFGAGSLTIDGSIDWSAPTATTTVSLNTGSERYPVTAEVDFAPADAVIASIGGGTLGQASAQLTLAAAPGPLSGGEHSGTVHLTATVRDETITATLPIEVLASEHVLYPSEDGVALLAVPGREKLTHTVEILDSYRVPGAEWTATSDAAWLTVTPSGLAGDPLTVTADTMGLAEGLHEAIVMLASPEAGIERAHSMRVTIWASSTVPTATDATSTTYSHILADPVRPYVYAHDGGTAIDVYNVHDRSLVTSLTVGTALGAMTASSDGEWLYVLDGAAVRRISLANAALPIETWTLVAGAERIGYFRPSGRGILALSTGHVIDADDGTQLAATPLPQFAGMDAIVASRKPDELCVVNGGTTPFTGSCATWVFSTHGAIGIHLASSVAASGHNTPSGTAGFSRDLAMRSDGERILIANSVYSGTGNLEMPVMLFDGRQSAAMLQAMDTGGATGGGRAVEAGTDGDFYAVVRSSSTDLDTLWIYNEDNSVRLSLPLNAVLQDTQLDVSADGASAVLLAAPDTSSGSTLRFIRTY